MPDPAAAPFAHGLVVETDPPCHFAMAEQRLFGETESEACPEDPGMRGRGLSGNAAGLGQLLLGEGGNECRMRSGHRECSEVRGLLLRITIGLVCQHLVTDL